MTNYNAMRSWRKEAEERVEAQMRKEYRYNCWVVFAMAAIAMAAIIAILKI